MKVNRIEIDTNSVRFFLKNGKVLTGSLKDIDNLKTEQVFFSMFPGIGIGGQFRKKDMLVFYKDYDLVIKSAKLSNFTFIGMIKPVTYNNIRTFLKKHRIRSKHIYITPFTLHRFAEKSEKRQIVVYKGDVMIHMESFENGFPVFAGSYVSFRQLDEFISEFYEDGNAILTILSNRRLDYTPPVEFKDTYFHIREGVILNVPS